MKGGRSAARSPAEGDPLQSGKLTALGSHPIGTVGRDPTVAASSHTLDLLRLGRGPTRARTGARLNLAPFTAGCIVAAPLPSISPSPSRAAASWTAAHFPLAADRHNISTLVLLEVAALPRLLLAHHSWLQHVPRLPCRPRALLGGEDVPLNHRREKLASDVPQKLSGPHPIKLALSAHLTVVRAGWGVGGECLRIWTLQYNSEG